MDPNNANPERLKGGVTSLSIVGREKKGGTEEEIKKEERMSERERERGKGRETPALFVN